MANISEVSTWSSNIYQIGSTDPVQGGSDSSIDNLPHKQIADRLQKIKTECEKFGIPISTTYTYKGQNIIPTTDFEGTVADGELVFRNESLNQFEQAIADGTVSAEVIGVADVTNSHVIANGLVYIAGVAGGLAVSGDILYLSSTVAGGITTTVSDVPIGKYIYDDIIFISALGVGSSSSSGSGSVEQVEYSNLLQNSYYLNCTFDLFSVIAASDALVSSTTMSYDAVNTRYNFTVGEILTSTNLFDSESGLTEIEECMVSVNYVDSGTPTIEVTADGGSHWESVTNNTIHTFTNTGIDLRFRFTASGTGTLSSFCILYNVDLSRLAVSVTGNRLVNFNYEGQAVDEDIIIKGILFNNSVGISHITINSRVAPLGSDLTIDITKDDVEQSNISTLTAGSTSEKTALSSIIHFSTTEEFGLKIKTVGSIEAGQGLNITIHYYDR